MLDILSWGGGFFMEYKLAAIDMDGTLIASDGISEKTKIVLKQVEEKGVEVVITTGRILQSARYHYEDIGLKGRLIACNGGIITDANSGKIIYENPLDKDKVVRIAKMADVLGLDYNMYSEDKLYVLKNSQGGLDGSYDYQEEYRKEGVSISYLENIEDLDLSTSKIYKIIFIEKDGSKLEDFRGKLSKISGISISSSWPNNLEIMNEGVSKGEALRILSKKYKINMKDIIAFGDNENDLDMITSVGLGVAMENGIDLIKENADIITRSNDEDGVAMVLEKYILNMED